LEVKLLDPNGEIILVKGKWSKERIQGDYCYDENPLSYSAFYSEIGMANISGDYKLILNYVKNQDIKGEDSS